RYVQGLQFNSKPYSKNWIDHFELLKGGTLNFTMSATPNKARGTAEKDTPYSLSASSAAF
ncbi:MAG TPA: glycoside hydrolase domain-containing protein, partial [Chitinophagaceae bacterium]|nr:glycoside hydrolase domain-containing protein [Chitinophagaceae bacterium]